MIVIRPLLVPPLLITMMMMTTTMTMATMVMMMTLTMVLMMMIGACLRKELLKAEESSIPERNSSACASCCCSSESELRDAAGRRAGSAEQLSGGLRGAVRGEVSASPQDYPGSRVRGVDLPRSLTRSRRASWWAWPACRSPTRKAAVGSTREATIRVIHLRRAAPREPVVRCERLPGRL